jgi:D-alanyl-D-alanine carboxypeptidase (penicillin-binding protein 5/6)
VQLSARLEKAPELNAPIAKGARVGDIVVNLKDKELVRVPLVALQAVNEGSLWQRARDTILQWF